MSEEAKALADFKGTARLFPLPNLVLFPHVVQPLHIFEPRYRQMTQHALEGDRLIAIVLLKPGWEETYEGAPPIYDLACLGRIITEQRLPDGKYNLLLRGLSRIRLLEEVPDLNMYRSARCQLLPDVPRPGLADIRKTLLDEATRWLPALGEAAQQLLSIFQGDIPLGALCDIMAFMLPLPIEVKQALLEELDLERRAGQLVEAFRQHTPPELLPMPREKRPWPPDFSDN